MHVGACKHTFFTLLMASVACLQTGEVSHLQSLCPSTHAGGMCVYVHLCVCAALTPHMQSHTHFHGHAFTHSEKLAKSMTKHISLKKQQQCTAFWQVIVISAL